MSSKADAQPPLASPFSRKTVVVIAILLLFNCGLIGYLLLPKLANSFRLKLSSHSRPAKTVVSVFQTCQITFDTAPTHLQLSLFMPPDLPRRQRVIHREFSPPSPRVRDSKGILLADFVFDTPARQFSVQVSSVVELIPYDVELAQQGDTIAATPEQRAPYLIAEEGIELSDPGIRKVAVEITGTSDHEIVAQIYELVVQRVKYRDTHEPFDVGAAHALARGYGVCRDQSSLMIALCRVRGIPARPATGIYVSKYGEQMMSHEWVEVYLERLGWVPFDPTENRLNGMAGPYLWIYAQDEGQLLAKFNGQFVEYKVHACLNHDLQALQREIQRSDDQLRLRMPGILRAPIDIISEEYRVTIQPGDYRTTPPPETR